MTPVYTLLIVESPVIARIIQQLVPSSVYVVATGGYCWKPKFNYRNSSLQAIADPNLSSVRKELKEQAGLAGTVIIATDTDPSGDFIAWSVARFLKTNTVKRGKLQNLSRSGILSMMDEIREMDTEQLEVRLKNRFLIRHEWYHQKEFPELELSGFISLFSGRTSYRHFVDENNELHQSSVPVKANPDQWISLSKIDNETKYFNQNPLSLYDLIPALVQNGTANSYHTAQNDLQNLFEASLPDEQVSLISYPRTGAFSFYSETWDVLQTQYLKLGLQEPFKPNFLRDIADPEIPHESIHPLNLGIGPEAIRKRVPSELSQIYSLIHDHTLQSVQIPAPLHSAWFSELDPEVYFYSLIRNGEKSAAKEIFLRPCITLSDAGKMLDRLGVLRPSGFGKAIDKWVNEGWATISGNVINPGKSVQKYLGKSSRIYKTLQELNDHADSFSLNSATIQSLITSN